MEKVKINPTEVEIQDRLHILLERLDKAEQRAVLQVLDRVLEAFEVGNWTLGKA